MLPIGAEPVQKRIPDKDVYPVGWVDNDFERPAAARLIRRIRAHHPKLRITVVQDALHSNTPYIQLLREVKMGLHFKGKER